MKTFTKSAIVLFTACFLLFSALPSYAGNPTFARIKKAEATRQQLVKKGLPDLVVSIQATAGLKAGKKIPSCKIKVKNIGTRTAKGTKTAGNKGYMVDVVLSSNSHIPMALAAYSPSFHEDVLLQGGRISITPDLKPGQSKVFDLSGVLTIPANTPAGSYYVGGFVDSAAKIRESNERNNTTARRVKIAAKAQVRPFQVISPNMSQDFQIVANKIRIKVVFNKVVKKASILPKVNFRVKTEKDFNAAGTITWVNNHTLIWTSTKAVHDLLTFDPDGFFKLIILDSVEDSGGTGLDGDKNGVEGGTFTNDFILLG